MKLGGARITQKQARDVLKAMNADEQRIKGGWVRAEAGDIITVRRGVAPNESGEVVNERSGEMQAPSEYVANLRALELSIQRADEDIFRLKADLKVAKEFREKLVAQLRTAIREGTVLPLLEAEDHEPEAV